MELDAAFRLLGNRYHIILYSVLTLTLFLSAFVLMGMIFMGSAPESFYCTPPLGFLPNETLLETPVLDSCHMYEVHDGIVTGNITDCIHGWTYVTDFGETTIIMDVSNENKINEYPRINTKLKTLNIKMFIFNLKQ